MDNEKVVAALQKYFGITSKEAVDLDIITSLEYSSLVRFGEDIIRNYVDGVLNRQQDLFETLKFLSGIIDRSEDEEIYKSDNVVIIGFLYDTIYRYNAVTDHDLKLRNLIKTIMEKKEYSMIVKEIYRGNSITPSELSNATGLSIQRIVGCIKKLGTSAIVTVRSPFNARKVWYRLHADLRTYITHHAVYMYAPDISIW